MPTGRKLTQEQKVEVLRLSETHTNAQIAKMLDLGNSTVCRLTQRRKPAKRQVSVSVSVEDYKTVCDVSKEHSVTKREALRMLLHPEPKKRFWFW